MLAVRTAILLAILAAPCAGGDFLPSPHLRFDVTSEELQARCRDAQARAETRLTAIAAAADAPTFQGTAVALDMATTALGNDTASDRFLKDISVSPEVRKASLACSTAVAQFLLEVYTREDLFRSVRAFANTGPSLAGEDRRLLEKQLRDFERNGLMLPPPARQKLKRLRLRIVEIEQQFGKNVAEDRGGIWLTLDELAGMPEDYRARLQQADGKYRVTVDYPDYYPFLMHATHGDTRRRLMQVFENRAAGVNRPLLREVLRLRREAARLQGYPSHADYKLVDNMAKNRPAVEQFLQKLTTRLQVLARRELAEMSALKRQDVGPRGDARIYAWDWRYYDEQIRRQRYEFDEEEVRAYFPLEAVTRGLFEVYEGLLGIRIRRVPDAATWHADVQLFEVRDAAGGEPIAYFYMDLFPREGKYKHMAEFPLVIGRGVDGHVGSIPIMAIVANFNPPTPGRPSLLTHGRQGDVETLFHEFGHAMHETLTRARYGRFSGTSVDVDFVEAPSAMLENWVWQPEIVGAFAARYDDPSQKLPPALLARLSAARLANSGVRSLNQLNYAAIDLAYHSARLGDTTKTWQKSNRDVFMIPLPPGTHPDAAFAHLTEGYDAGYYGYLWAKAYAEDMFTRFREEGLLNPETGRRYRETILAPGGGRDALDLVKEFLGREPSEEPLLRSLGLDPSPAP